MIELEGMTLLNANMKQSLRERLDAEIVTPCAHVAWHHTHLSALCGKTRCFQLLHTTPAPGWGFRIHFEPKLRQ